ncbi:hypothetical protein SRHO_G00060740 [Serrasalmus rhombeus]
MEQEMELRSPPSATAYNCFSKKDRIQERQREEEQQVPKENDIRRLEEMVKQQEMEIARFHKRQERLKQKLEKIKEQLARKEQKTLKIVQRAKHLKRERLALKEKEREMDSKREQQQEKEEERKRAREKYMERKEQRRAERRKKFPQKETSFGPEKRDQPPASTESKAEDLTSQTPSQVQTDGPTSGETAEEKPEWGGHDGGEAVIIEVESQQVEPAAPSTSGRRMLQRVLSTVRSLVEAGVLTVNLKTCRDFSKSAPLKKGSRAAVRITIGRTVKYTMQQPYSDPMCFDEWKHFSLQVSYMRKVAMEIVFEKTVGNEVDAELELQQVVNAITQRTQGTCIVPKHYNLQEDSSEEDDLTPGHALQEGSGDCMCCVCGETFAFLNNLIEHFSVHKDEVRCHLCQVTFTRVISLALHLENAHPKYHLYCKSCKISFLNTWHMNQHMEKHLEMFQNCKVEEPDDLTSSCSMKHKSVDEDVEEVVIEKEEVEIMYLKEEEEEKEVVLRKMQETKEDDSEANLWECAPIEEDIIKEEDEENVEIKEESDSSLLDDSVYSPARYLNSDSDTDAAFCMSSDSNSNIPVNGLPRLLRKSQGLRTRSIQKRQTCTNTNEKPREMKETSTTKTTEEDQIAYTILRDHNYFCTHSLGNPSGSDQAPAYNTRSSARFNTDSAKNINNATLHAFNNEEDTMDCKDDQQEKVEVVVLRTMPRREDTNHKGRAILQATYEKVFKIQKLGNMPSNTEQEPPRRSSVSSSTSAALELAQLELDIKVEDDSEDNLWECAPIEEDILKEEDEENVEIKEESDSSLLDDSVYSPEKDMNSDSDSDAASCITSDNNVTVPTNILQRLLGKSKGPEPSSIKGSQICSSCGLSKVSRMEKPMERCKCMPLFTCYMCGVTCGSDQLLQKHQAEIHPLTKYVCSACLLVFPNQTSFTKHACCTRVPSGQIPTPAKIANTVKSPSTMILKFVPSPAVGVPSKQPLNNGCSQAVPSLNVIYSNNLINVVDTSQKHGTLSASTIPVLPDKPSYTQTAPVQVSATMMLNSEQKVKSLVLKGQDPASSLTTSTQDKTGPVQVLIPASSSASMKPREVVLQGVVLPQQRPVRVPVCTSSPVSLSASNQSKVALRIPTYPTTSTNVTVSFSPTPVQFPTPALVSASSMKTLPLSTSQRLPGNVRPVTVPLTQSVPAPVASAASTQAHVMAPIQSSINLEGSCSTSSPVQVPPCSENHVKIVAMFVNQSQELVLEKRLRQSWHSKTIFPCRHCGAIARQPSLGIRHRYQHRGPRLHRCQCGRTFQRQLHLLRHQVQHAEAMRYVCAACGQTFQGTHHLASHKRKVFFRFRPSDMKKGTRRECRNVFHCDCGQAFARSSALLWHMLKNSKSSKRFKKLLLI